VRLILGLALMLVGIGHWFCYPDVLSAPTPTVAGEVPWVRTVDGWERTGSWLASPSQPPRLHPLVVAAGQLLLSLFALALWCNEGNSDPSPVAATGLRRKG
jgi:hypothetical protein